MPCQVLDTGLLACGPGHGQLSQYFSVATGATNVLYTFVYTGRESASSATSPLYAGVHCAAHFSVATRVHASVPNTAVGE